uniref:Uncharacterized protein n=1 Tax=Arundo donax TaxID=35708 RepID=A0A0A9F9L4_ARUDO
MKSTTRRPSEQRPVG